MHRACHVFILFQILLISEFQRKALSDDGVIIAKDKQILVLRARRSVSGSQPLIQGSVAGTPSALNIAQQNLISASSYKGQPPGQSLTPFARATGQSITTVSAQPAVQPSSLNVKTQTEGQDTNSIQQTTGQSKGTGLPNGEELEEDPDMDQNSNDELDEYDDSETDPEVLTDCCRRRRRRRRRKCRHCFRQHFRYPRRRRLRGGGSRLREPMDDDYYFDRDRERVDDWLDFRGSPDYYGDNAEGGIGGNRGGNEGNEGNNGGYGGTGGNTGGTGGTTGGYGGTGGTGGTTGGYGGTGGTGGGYGGTGGTGGGYGGTGGTGGGGGGGGGGRAEGTDCCCVKWGGLKPHVEWVNVPVCYRPCCIAKPHCEHCCDIDCHHCACEPCCGGCCCHHCPCCHCCHHCCHCCHCRREIVANKPTRGRRKKAAKRKRTKTPKKKKYHKRHCFCVTPLIMRLPYFPRLW